MQLATPQVEGVAERDLIWNRGGVPVEDLPDPFTAPATPAAEPVTEPAKRRRWPLVLYTVAGLLAALLVWLVTTAPLSRALEPLDDPAVLLLSSEGQPIARRGAVKEAPVDVAKLDPLTPAAFVAIEDRRFYRHWGIDPRGIGRAKGAGGHHRLLARGMAEQAGDSLPLPV